MALKFLPPPDNMVRGRFRKHKLVRKFGGKRYLADGGTWQSKKEAMKVAGRLRKRGFGARVVSHRQFAKEVFTVYSSESKLNPRKKRKKRKSPRERILEFQVGLAERQIRRGR